MPELALIGFERSGKTTLFNALTGAARPTGYAAHSDPHAGVVEAADSRLDQLSALYKPKKHTPAALDLLDFPGAGFAGSLAGGQAPPMTLLDALSKADALIHVVRAFDDDSVPHPAQSVDPARDIESMQLELTFADLALIEKRLQRIAEETKSVKPADRVAADREADLLRRLQTHISDGGNVLDAPISDEERKSLRHYRFLTERPLLTLLNLAEDQAPDADSQLATLATAAPSAALCAKLEEELASFDPQDAAAYRSDLGIADGAVETALKQSFALLGLRTFFTVGEDECRAWTIEGGASAQRAAGRIHSDLERGFIRAEVVPWNHLLDCGSEAEAKKRALLRTEGKDYEVQDGDVLHILFNV